ncbi:MAG: Fe-S cluster assembly ATPase SufC [Alkalimonas sp.]|uniref:Fe-S cluster assembly ATPase SufC n=1 Tax=Alkalimonas delamerensis TaxID=265981 RepID=A0ABT9GMY2_9GAMM|nr:Fe-S cluster assembly ATPase SufC [Alkalimonas delamerensis]MCC5852297.1 Fe-S cluster assembly ATPase SufC [Alkalimonas sp.]MDP4528297.1 Fe-S cluster assembly ATPase SufC [Alkalimonas delamerensis]
MLTIDNLHARVGQQSILKGLNLQIKPGEVHAIMGPNGAGKSTLSYLLSGRDGYEVEGGSVQFMDDDLLEMEVEDRARHGLFLAFQYPVEIPGVSNMEFMKESVNAIREQRGEEPLSAAEFLKKAKEACKQVQLPLDFLKRGVNEGFSGGEKKRNEIMQMILLEPKLCILDESDSGLDIDALQVVASGVNSQRNSERSFLVITHYQRLLDYIKPDFVHILANGKIVKSGDASLALKVEKEGYAFLGIEATEEASS